MSGREVTRLSFIDLVPDLSASCRLGLATRSLSLLSLAFRRDELNVMRLPHVLIPVVLHIKTALALTRAVHQQAIELRIVGVLVDDVSRHICFSLRSVLWFACRLRAVEVPYAGLGGCV